MRLAPKPVVDFYFPFFFIISPFSLSLPPPVSTPPIPSPHSLLPSHSRQLSLYAVLPYHARSSYSPSTLYFKRTRSLCQPYPFHYFRMSSQQLSRVLTSFLVRLSHQLPLSSSILRLSIFFTAPSSPPPLGHPSTPMWPWTSHLELCRMPFQGL